MERNEIIKLAMEYGFTGGFDAQGRLTYDETFVEAVTEAVKREREACLKICEAQASTNYWEGADVCAEAIRARGTNE